jgi:hypothetical protein
MPLPKMGVRVIKLPVSKYEQLVELAEGSADGLILLLRRVLACPDLLLVEDRNNGLEQRLYVRSATFTEYERCLCRAPEWRVPLVT